MRYLEELYELYKKQKKEITFDFEALPEIQDEKLTEIEQKLKQEKKEERTEYQKPEFEFGEIYYYITPENIPIFFMINGKIEGTDYYSVYKVSDFPDFATQNDFLFELDGLAYMVELWNEFFLTEDEIKDALFIGKLSEEEAQILEKAIDQEAEIPQDRRGLTILEGGNYVQFKFKNDEIEDVRDYQLRIFHVFETIEEKEEIEYLNQLLYKSLEEQENQIQVPEEAYASEEELFTEREDFIMRKEGNELIVRVINKNLVGKEGKIKIFGKVIEGTVPPEFKIKIPEKLKNISIEHIADNIKIEVKNE